MPIPQFISPIPQLPSKIPTLNSFVPTINTAPSTYSSPPRTSSVPTSGTPSLAADLRTPVESFYMSLLDNPPGGLFDKGGIGDPLTNPYLSLGSYTDVMGNWTPTEQIINTLASMGEVPAPVYTGGGSGGWGGGSGVAIAPTTWSEGYTLEGAPDWWRGLVPSAYDAGSEYIALYNSMIPTLSPEDQRAVGTYLYGAIPEDQRSPFASYNPDTANFAAPPGEMTTALKEKYTSSQRGQSALSALNTLKGVSGVEGEMGVGYDFLRSLLGVVQDFGGGVPGSNDRQSRQQFTQMQSGLDPLKGQTKTGALGAYSSLASQLSSPFFSAGQTVPRIQNKAGRYVFGKPNAEFYG